MSIENPLWGAPRIHGELLKLGFAVAQSSVAKYMVKRRGTPSQGWHFLGRMPRNTSFAIGMESTAPSSHVDCVPWASRTSLLHQPRLGRMALPNGIGSIRRECVDHFVVLGEAHLRRNSCEPMLVITTTSERIGHWITMRRSLAPFSRPESLGHTRSLADFITTTFGYRFSVHTGVALPLRATSNADSNGQSPPDANAPASRDGLS